MRLKGQRNNVIGGKLKMHSIVIIWHTTNLKPGKVVLPYQYFYL